VSLGIARGFCIAGLLEPREGTADRNANAEAVAVDRVLALPLPSDAAAGLVVEIPADAGDVVGQGQRHSRGVRSPGAKPWGPPAR